MPAAITRPNKTRNAAQAAMSTWDVDRRSRSIPPRSAGSLLPWTSPRSRGAFSRLVWPGDGRGHESVFSGQRLGDGTLYLRPNFIFPYPGFSEMIRPWSDGVDPNPLAVLALLALMLAAGLSPASPALARKRIMPRPSPGQTRRETPPTRRCPPGAVNQRNRSD